MAAPFVIACTHCESRLKLKDPSLAGKRIRCPKCGEPFVIAGGKADGNKTVAARPAKSQEEFSFLKHVDEEHYEAPEGTAGEDDEFGELPPSPLQQRKTAGKSGGKKKRKRASSGPGAGKVAMIAGLLVLGLALVGGVGYGLYLIISGLGGPSANRFAWLPDDSEMVVEVRVADLWNSEALQPLTSSQAAGQLRERFKSEAHISLTDVDRMVVGSKLKSKEPVVVVYARTPFDVPATTANHSKSDYGGQTLYASPSGNVSVFFPDSTTAVTGRETQLKAVIDRNGESAATARFANLPIGGHVVVGSLKPADANLMPPSDPGATPIDLQNVAMGAIALECTQNIDIHLAFECASESAAETLAGQLETDRSEGLRKIQMQKDAMKSNPLAGLVGGNAMLNTFETMLENYKIASSGKNVTGDVKLPGKVIKDLSDAINMMLPAMMQSFERSSGLNGAGGAPPAAFEVPATVPSEGQSTGSTPPTEHSEHAEAP